MTWRQVITLVVFVTLIAVILLGLLPLRYGPFSATHGPVTALRSQRLAALLFAIIASLPHCLNFCAQVVAVRNSFVGVHLVSASLERAPVVAALLC